ncbi:unnamed protein product [Rotaria sp. Silwood2]|nr:unnamed protein product [Rotaria sp. Silwood2]CAF4675307.1 unnamed protein product [Rotaria sp. Silwood2]
MKNHYKIHAQNYERFDHDAEDSLPPPLALDDITTNSNQNQLLTAAALAPVVKVEMLDWLRSDLDDMDSSSTAIQLASDCATLSMKNLCVEESADKAESKDLVHVE